MSQHQYPDLLRLAVDESPDLLYIIDRETGRILDANDGATRALCYSRDELLSLFAWEIDATLRDGREPGFYRTHHRRADGSSFEVECRARAT